MHCVENTVHFPDTPFLNNSSEPHLIMGASQTVSAVKNIQFIHSCFQSLSQLSSSFTFSKKNDILADVNEAIIKAQSPLPRWKLWFACPLSKLPIPQKTLPQMETAASPASLEPVIILSGMEEERAESTLVKRPKNYPFPSRNMESKITP